MQIVPIQTNYAGDQNDEHPPASVIARTTNDVNIRDALRRARHAVAVRALEDNSIVDVRRQQHANHMREVWVRANNREQVKLTSDLLKQLL